MNALEVRSQTRLLIGAAAATCIANISWWMQPQIINDVLTTLKVSESAAGFVITAEFATLSLTSFVVARVAQGMSYWLICLVGAVLAIGGAMGTLSAHGYASLIALRALTGIGEGAFLMVSTAAVAHLANPDRTYGQLNIVNVCLGAAMSLGLPWLAGRFGAEALSFRLLATLMILLVLLALPIPRTERFVPPTHRSHDAGGVSSRVFAHATAIFLVAVASSAMWSFYVVLGLRAGLSAAAVDTTIGYAVLSALPAGVLATLVGTRFGRFRAMAAAIVVMVATVFAMTHSIVGAAFRAGACLNVACMYFLIPYFFGGAAAEDASGRAAAIAGGAFLLTGAAGPYLGGWLMQYLGVASISWFMLLANSCAAALFFWLEHSRPARAATASVAVIPR